MALDAHYVIAPSLQEYFVDKDSGLPLIGGKVYFYSDVNRTTLKAIYTLSGTYPSYTYTQLANPVTLSAVGTFQDDNDNDILPYYYPYDSDGNVELYHIVVKDADGVPQFTRQAYPNLVSSNSVVTNDITNYIPNGQFLSHTDVPATLTTDAGEIKSDVTDVAQGGWTFERSTGSTARDFVTFDRFGSYISGSQPTGNPRYSIKVICESADEGDPFKDLRVKFKDVNKFANSDSTKYTLSFTGISNGSSFNVDINLIKNFGTDGSAEETINITTETLTSDYQIFNATVDFTSNAGKTIGIDNDDYIQLAIAFPNEQFSANFTDFILTPGEVVINEFPVQTDADMLTRGVAGWMPTPNPDGSDLYLPLLLTKEGLTFSNSDIGKVFPAVYSAAKDGELLCDGAQYKTSEYSSIGIPYSRLQAILLANTPLTNVPVFGTGANFSTIYISDQSPAVTSIVRLSNNTFGMVATAAQNGAIPTNFTFSNIYLGSSSHLWAGYTMGASKVLVRTQTVPAVPMTDAAAGNSGFTVASVKGASEVEYYWFTVQTIAAASMTAGHYFTFHNAANAAYYMWFKIGGVGVDPAPGGTGILVNLKSTYTAIEVANCLKDAISGCYSVEITDPTDSAMAAGSYFIFDAPNSNFYYVWYKVSGSGTDPNVSDRTGIQVDILSGDTAIQVMAKTQLAVNSTYYATPDLRGAFIRGYGATNQWDLGSASRFALNSTGVYGNNVGTYEYDTNEIHKHVITVTGQQDGEAAGGTGAEGYHQLLNQDTQTSGNYESRPTNIQLNYVIKY